MAEFRLNREEQETNILTNAASDTWSFFTLDPKFVRRMTKLGYKLEKDHQGGWSCRLPLEKVTIRSARIAKRKVSEASMRALQVRKQSARLDTNREISGLDHVAMVGVGG